VIVSPLLDSNLGFLYTLVCCGVVRKNLLDIGRLDHHSKDYFFINFYEVWNLKKEQWIYGTPLKK
jgi:hypothetical protein